MLLVLKGWRTSIVNSYSIFSIHAPDDFPKGGPGRLVTKLVFNHPSIYTRLALGDRGWGHASLACRHAPQKKKKLQLCRKNAEFLQKRDINSQKFQKMAKNDLSVEKQIQKPVLPVKRSSNMAWFNNHHQWGWLRHRGWLRHLISHISIQLWLKKKLVPEKLEMPSTLFREGIRLQKMQNTKLCNFGLTPGQKSIPLFTTENCLK